MHEVLHPMQPEAMPQFAPERKFHRAKRHAFVEGTLIGSVDKRRNGDSAEGWAAGKNPEILQTAVRLKNYFRQRRTIAKGVGKGHFNGRW
jgi:hypothetical protein